jgi:hypothetical protein
MLKKADRKNDVVDVPADDPVGTMDRFTVGLKKVLAVPKHHKTATRQKRKKHN